MLYVLTKSSRGTTSQLLTSLQSKSILSTSGKSFSPAQESDQVTFHGAHYDFKRHESHASICFEPAAITATPKSPNFFSEVAESAGVNGPVQWHPSTAPNCLFSEPAKLAEWGDLVTGGHVDGNQPSNQGPDKSTMGQVVYRAMADVGGFCFPERNSGSAAVGDFDNDGWTDILVLSLEHYPALYRNNGDGTFSDVAEARGIIRGLPAVEDGGRTNGAAFADLDGDGDLDLYITTMGGHRHFLFINDGSGFFSEEAEKRGARVLVAGDKTHTSGGSIGIGDYDNDGWIDMYVTEWRQTFLQDLSGTEGFSSNSRLLRNLGGSGKPGYFEDVTDKAGVDIALPSRKFLGESQEGGSFTSTGTYSFSAHFVDLDEDGHKDLAIVADFGTTMLYWNNGDGTFTEGAKAAGVNRVENGMGSTLSDIDGDGKLDWFISSIYDPRGGDETTPFGTLGNRMYRYNGDRKFEDVTDKLQLDKSDWAWGAAFIDIDNDADEDLYVSTGFVIPETTFDDIWNLTPNRFFVNPGKWGKPWNEMHIDLVGGDQRFVDKQGRGVLVFDYDRDGDQDIFVMNHADKPFLLRNDRGNNHDFLQVAVLDGPGKSDSVGAIVELTLEKGGSARKKIIDSVTGFQGQSELFAHFGLGFSFAKSPVYKVKVTWSDKTTKEVLRVPRNGRIVIAKNAPESFNMRGKRPPCNVAADAVSSKASSIGAKKVGVNRKPLPKSLLNVVDHAAEQIAEALQGGASRMKWRPVSGVYNDERWGAAGENLLRKLAPEYADGLAKPAGPDRPSARHISNVLFAQGTDIPSSNGLSDIASHMGQFIAHDTDHTTPQANVVQHEYFPIQVPSDDTHFENILRFRRSIHDPETGIRKRPSQNLKGGATAQIKRMMPPLKVQPRQQINKITSYLDLGVVYGSDEMRMEELRAKRLGRLATSDGDFLPFNKRGKANDNPLARPISKLFLAGDARANIQPGLLAMHTIWVREHNVIADAIADSLKARIDSSYFASVDDEEEEGGSEERTKTKKLDDLIFHFSRRITIAEYQAVVFEEYLPAILGKKMPKFSRHRKDVNPGIANVFATAAFRFGHSQANEVFARVNADGTVSESPLLLNRCYFRPDILAESEESFNAIVRGMLLKKAQAIDLHVVDGLRNFLFGPRQEGGLDLAAINIQRGRDHGIPSFSSVRAAYGLERSREFRDIAATNEVASKLEELYRSVDSIDAWVGMLAEKPVTGGEVGETMAAVLKEQFLRLRDGDPYWYENIMTSEDAASIKGTKMSSILDRNADVGSISVAGKNVMYVREVLS